MSLEFVARNGLIALDSSQITGSLTITGNVGIGTASPARKLDVNGTSIFRDFTTVVASNGNAVSNITWLSTDSGIMNIYTGGSAAVQLNSNGVSYFNGGNVGIGTTAPARTLHVSSAGTDGTQVQINGTLDSAGIKFIPASGDNWEV